MRTKHILWTVCPLAAITAAVLLVGWAAQSQAQVTERTPARADQRGDLTHSKLKIEKICRASNVIGMNVQSLNGDTKIGSIEDLVLDQDGRVKYVAVSFGGFLGIGNKLFAVPFEAIEFVNAEDDAYARIDITEESLKLNKGFNQDKWPTESDRSFMNGNMRRQANASPRSW